jgi:hypothetical protein
MSTKDRVLQAGDIVKLSDNTNPELVKELVDHRDKRLERVL